MSRRPEVVPNVRDHDVKPPPASAYTAPNPDGWMNLSKEHQDKLLSAYARFGGEWPEYLTRDILRGAPVPPIVQERAVKLREAFLAHPRRGEWLGDFPGEGT